MITTTIITSTSENARLAHFWILASGFSFLLLLQYISRLQDGQHGREDDEEDDDGKEDDEERLEDGGQALGGRVDLLIVGLGELVEHFFEAAGLLAYGEDLDDHGGEGAGSADGVADVAAGGDGLFAGGQGVAEHEVAGGALCDLECADEDDAAAQEGAEDNGDADDGLFFNQVADQGEGEGEAVPVALSARG